MLNRLRYYRRMVGAYILPGVSQLTFWHENPELNEGAPANRLGEYYMTFAQKADYAGPFDARGIPLLDYRGAIGLQHNPIAIAQYGLGNCTMFMRSREPDRKARFLRAADWLTDHLERNPKGIEVWNHKFDWEYRTCLKSPWYAGLAQGQGISLLVRAHQETHEDRYLSAARRAFVSLTLPVGEGGVIHTDEKGHPWIEEYIVDPPTHILNGFIWALWGVHDYSLATGDPTAADLFDRCLVTLRHNLDRYDNGFWSLYEQSGTRLRMIASPFYHSLHIVQLRVLNRLTGDETFLQIADRWDAYRRRRWNRTRAWIQKALFKIFYY